MLKRQQICRWVGHCLIGIVLTGLFTESTATATTKELSTAEKLNLIWALAKDQIYPKALEERFSEQRLGELKQRAAAHPNLAFSELVNPFLHSLGVSHTHLYDEHQLGYYFLRSLFTTRRLHSPKMTHIGIQVATHPKGLLVRAVLDGLTADRAGIQRGDIIVALNGKPISRLSDFFPFRGKRVVLDVAAGDRVRKVALRPIHQSPHYSFVRATKNSIRIIKRGDKRFGYIHLWAGTHRVLLKTLRRTVMRKFKGLDGVILDLRDGFGGAWWDYLNPFYENTDTYFVATQHNRDGTTRTWPPYEKKKNKGAFTGPLVVLINGGVRSGKEALAYQFKKTNRATLVGTTTAGASTAGLGGYATEKYDFLFYLSVFELRPDGHKIEGVGIAPDIEIEYERGPNGEDSQLERGIEALLATIAREDAIS